MTSASRIHLPTRADAPEPGVRGLAAWFISYSSWDTSATTTTTATTTATTTTTTAAATTTTNNNDNDNNDDNHNYND